MALPAQAVLGEVTINAVNILKVVDYAFKGEIKTTEVGPWVGENTITDIPGGLKETCEFTCDVPEGVDAAQTAVFTAIKAGTHPELIFVCDDGYTLTYPTPTYTGYDGKGEAKAGQQIKFSVSGACTITATA
jgi:hypothetical protein